ncbi:MAG: hypothetical protein FJ290_03790 [Planctomycetes bacterium]|nr:hypothetical protein [Planctomycetota bacterium]
MDNDRLDHVFRRQRQRRIGPYSVAETLGSGGMGIVYKAADARSGEAVAVKLIHSHLLLDSRALERFKREISILSSVRHEHIVAIREYGEHEGVPYFVMDYVAGAPLARVVEGLQRLPPQVLGAASILGACASPEAWRHARPQATGLLPEEDYWRAFARIALTLARALGYLHGKGIVHRDIKPSNVVLRPDGSPVLMDMGVARGPNDITVTSSGAVVGTPRYLAPEQLSGRQPVTDQQSDIYQLGATLYELLYLEPVFAGWDDLRLCEAKARAEPVPSRGATAPPTALAAIVRKCLLRDRSLRYRTAIELAGDLQGFLEGRLVGPVGEAPQAASTGLWLGAGLVAGAVLVAVVAVAIAALVARGPSTPQRGGGGKVLPPPHKPPPPMVIQTKGLVNSLAFNPSGRLAWGTSVGWVRLWDVERRTEAGRVDDHGSSIEAMAFDPAGERLAFGAREGAVNLWSGRGGEAPKLVGTHDGPVVAVGFLDGATLVSAAADGAVQLWDLGAAGKGRELAKRGGGLSCMAVCRTRKLLACGTPAGGVLLGEATGGGGLREIGKHASRVAAVAFRTDGALLASGAEDGVRLWDASPGKGFGTEAKLSGGKGIRVGLNAMAFSPNGEVLAVGSGLRIELLRPAAGEALSGFAGQGLAVSSLAFRPDGKLLASGWWDGTIRLWTVAVQE